MEQTESISEKTKLIIKCKGCDSSFNRTKEFCRHLWGSCDSFKKKFQDFFENAKKIKKCSALNANEKNIISKKEFLKQPEKYSTINASWTDFFRWRKKKAPWEHLPSCVHDEYLAKKVDFGDNVTFSFMNSDEEENEDVEIEDVDITDQMEVDDVNADSDDDNNQTEVDDDYTEPMEIEKEVENESEKQTFEPEKTQKTKKQTRKQSNTVLELMSTIFETFSQNSKNIPQFKLFDDNFLLSECSDDEKGVLKAAVKILYKFTKNAKENLKKLEKIATSFDDLLKEIPGPIIFLVKYLSISSFFRKTHVDPLLSELNSNFCRKSTIDLHFKSINKKFNAILLLSNLLVNVNNQLRPSSLKIITTMTMKKKNVPKEIIQALETLGATVSSANYNKFAENSPAVKNMQTELWKKQEEGIGSKMNLWISDNKYYEIAHNEIGRNKSVHGYMTVTCEVLTLQKPSSELKQKMSDPAENTLQLPIPESDLKKIDFLACSDEENQEMMKSWNETFKCIAEEKDLYDFKQNIENSGERKTSEICLESLIGNDLSESDNFKVDQHIRKQIEQNCPAAKEKNPDLVAIHVADHHGYTAARKMIFSREREHKINGLNWPGDWHV